MNFKETKLGTIVTELPNAAPILRKYNLDYCCGGKKTLSAACEEQGLPAEEVISELIKIKPVENYRPEDLTPGGITAYIVRRYHNDLRKRLPDLCLLAKKVEQAHAGSADLPKGLSLLLNDMMLELFNHMNKEERILFPLIESGQLNFVKAPINRMEFEHDQHGENLRALKALTNNFVPPEGACKSWKHLYEGLEDLEAELMDHINLENNVLFPRALNSLVP